MAGKRSYHNRDIPEPEQWLQAWQNEPDGNVRADMAAAYAMALADSWGEGWNLQVAEEDSGVTVTAMVEDSVCPAPLPRYLAVFLFACDYFYTDSDFTDPSRCKMTFLFERP